MVNIIDRIQPNIIKVKGGCWIWIANRVGNGYGQINLRGGKKRLVHRVLWEILRGPIPQGMILCHKCDKPSCCNPDHLFIGTYKDNSDDMWAKGRGVRPQKKTHCVNGHPFTTENTFLKENGTKGCKQCNRDRALKWKWEHIEEVRASQRKGARP